MKQFVLLILSSMFFMSCVSYKQVPYFSDLPLDSTVQEQITNSSVVKIQKNDVLAITVSSLNVEASAIFNVGNTTSAQGNALANPLTTSNGFIVDEDGAIQLPLIGSIRVAGLSTKEAREIIKGKLEKYLKEPVVNLRINNFRISVLGDVVKPGVYPVENENMTIANALSLAGDLNITAMRKNVLLIREIENSRKYIRIDMTSKTLFNSPYYYLRNNDVIYVQPSNTKYSTVDPSYRYISVGLSIMSLIFLIITR